MSRCISATMNTGMICTHCKRDIASRIHYLRCNQCDALFHRKKCVSPMPSKEYGQLKRNDSWECYDCKLPPKLTKEIGSTSTPTKSAVSKQVRPTPSASDRKKSSGLKPTHVTSEVQNNQNSTPATLGTAIMPDTPVALGIQINPMSAPATLGTKQMSQPTPVILGGVKKSKRTAAPAECGQRKSDPTPSTSGTQDYGDLTPWLKYVEAKGQVCYDGKVPAQVLFEIWRRNERVDQRGQPKLCQDSTISRLNAWRVKQALRAAATVNGFTYADEDEEESTDDCDDDDEKLEKPKSGVKDSMKAKKSGKRAATFEVAEPPATKMTLTSSGREVKSRIEPQFLSGNAMEESLNDYDEQRSARKKKKDKKKKSRKDKKERALREEEKSKRKQNVNSVKSTYYFHQQ